MSTTVLARKYRPKNFADMVGQEPVVQALSHALENQRLHHAYLFTGTRGIGKTTISRILAKCLNCTGPDGSGTITATPCGVCPACTAIDADRYLDYTELDAASNRGIDDARDLIERASYKPSVGRFKVFMIDEAHQLTKDAFNALLKTLEEPPEYLKFVLATTDPEKMLPTVLSRCLQFNLRPMPAPTVAMQLSKILRAESVAHDETALRLLARAARGSMRDGLSLTDQAIAHGGGQVGESGVRSMLGAVEHGHCAALIEALAARDGAALLARVAHLREHGHSARGTLEGMARVLQHMAVQQAVPGALDATDDEQADATRLAALLPADQTQLLYSIVLRGAEELRLMSDEYGALTMVLLRLLAFAPSGHFAAAPRAAAATAPVAVPVAAAVAAAPAALPASAAVPPASRYPAQALAQPGMVVASPEPPPWLDVEAQEAAAPAAAAPRSSAPLRVADAAVLNVPAPPPPPPAPALQPTALGQQWASAVAGLAEKNLVAALLRELAMQAELRSTAGPPDAPRWQLVVERDSLRTDALRDKLAAALAQSLGHPVTLELLAGVAQDSPARRDAALCAQRQAQAEDTVRNDPLVVDMLAQFKGARIVPGSIKPL